MIPHADALDDATQLQRAFGRLHVAKRQNVPVRDGIDKAIGRQRRELPVPKVIDQQEARFEIAIEDHDESIGTGMNLGASIVQQQRQVGDRVSMKFRFGHAFRQQMAPLDVLKSTPLIDDISDHQLIAELGKNRRILCR
jgi:hypothetical protein